MRPSTAFTRYLLLSLLLIHVSCFLRANVTLPAIFSDSMVLQQNSEVRLWGWAKSLETVTVTNTWNDEVLTVTADNQAQWAVTLHTPAAGGPFEIHIKGYNEVVLHDILIGEVWVCSGQSNMEWSARLKFNNWEEEVKNANYPNIRLFSVQHRTATSPQIDLVGRWVPCTPETMIDFSAVAYFFARKLQQEMNVPIGLINSSWGGTPAEAWIPEETIRNDKVLNDGAALLQPVRWGPVEPARIYNAMIAPLIPFKIAGAIWYQGESNTGNPLTYKEMMTGLITSWRQKWGDEFPFYFAQIAPYTYGPTPSGAQVRDAQRRTLEVPNTGMVVTSDIGDTTDIHPRNKQDVGLRMAMLALVNHYKKGDAVVSGPLYKSFEVKGDKIIIQFDNAEGLHGRGGPLTHFEIAGKDNVFLPAIATIKNNTVELQSPLVKKPLSARFAWGNTATPNLFNGVELPASCFSTE